METDSARLESRGCGRMPISQSGERNLLIAGFSFRVSRPLDKFRATGHGTMYLLGFRRRILEEYMERKAKYSIEISIILRINDNNIPLLFFFK